MVRGQYCRTVGAPVPTGSGDIRPENPGPEADFGRISRLLAQKSGDFGCFLRLPRLLLLQLGRWRDDRSVTEEPALREEVDEGEEAAAGGQEDDDEKKKYHELPMQASTQTS